MKKILLLLTSVALAATVRADLAINEQTVVGDRTVASVTKYRGDKVRMDATPEASVIFDLKSGEIITLMHAQKAAMTMPGSAVKTMLASASNDLKMEPPQATGKKETINGYECDEYVMKVNGGTIRMWLTDQLPAAQKLAAEIAALSGDNAFAAMMKNEALPGYPLKTVMEIPGMPVTTRTVVSILKDDLPDSEFKVPAGYKAISMPAIPGQ